MIAKSISDALEYLFASADLIKSNYTSDEKIIEKISCNCFHGYYFDGPSREMHLLQAMGSDSSIKSMALSLFVTSVIEIICFRDWSQAELGKQESGTFTLLMCILFSFIHNNSQSVFDWDRVWNRFSVIHHRLMSKSFSCNALLQLVISALDPYLLNSERVRCPLSSYRKQQCMSLHSTCIAK